MKTVRPINKERWICLLAVCFTSKKAFAWDLDYGSGDLETVQGHLLRFFCEHELPLVVWSDNAGAFRNVIEQALLKACGLKARHIPPGRPQSNGLVEVFNRILDQGHMGEWQNLLSAVLAHNTRPDPALGASPETLWRTLHPAMQSLCLTKRGSSIWSRVTPWGQKTSAKQLSRCTQAWLRCRKLYLTDRPRRLNGKCRSKA